MSKYFKDCRTAEDCKKTYKELAKKLHPDNGGNAEEFKTMQAEYSRVWDRLKNIHVSAEGETYTKQTNETPEEFMNIIDKLIHCEGCTIELCGSWIWITGNTYRFRNEIKSLGFRWSKKKSAWYWHNPEEEWHKSKKTMSLDDIRNYYGSEVFNTVPQMRLAGC